MEIYLINAPKEGGPKGEKRAEVLKRIPGGQPAHIFIVQDFCPATARAGIHAWTTTFPISLI
jgi:hypothetical protein